ncbi:alpha/beta hydrolase [Asticcacaulis sp. AND118]|uniref:alpha/beta hydrolase n=1 Tax=Asticcacaulis sp. AND118 TaxID=2840468 RepID=UPI00210703D7|nr:dienelactone hydrolase family protein [Asticcacaulis sp. AND118]
MIGLGRHWAEVLPDTAFAAPDGPDPFDMYAQASGRQWFSVKSVTVENRAQRLVEAREAFDATLRHIMTERGIDDPARVALVGFSQGSIMALDAVVSGRWPVAAVVAYSGRLSSPPPWAPASVPVLIVHGDQDEVIPFSESLDAAEKLKAAGLNVDAHILPGLSHSLNAPGSRLGSAFLARHLIGV